MDIVIRQEGKETVIDFDADMLGHQICMGIRKGLFGASSHGETSILNGELPDSVDRIAEAIGDLAQAIESLAPPKEPGPKPSWSTPENVYEED